MFDNRATPIFFLDAVEFRLKIVFSNREVACAQFSKTE